MLLSRRLSLPALIELCRTLRHYLSSGIMLRDAFRHQAESGPPTIRPVAARIAANLKTGNDLEHALEQESGYFPPLFLALARVGEQTGMLPEVFREMEHFYMRQLKLRRDFISQITLPVIQFVAAVFVIAGMILILGLIAKSRGPGEKPFDPLGLGLSGPAGALTFLAFVGGTLFALLCAWYIVVRVFRKQSVLDSLLLRVPVLGSALHALALSRFCMALRLTTETGMSIAAALRLSMRATGNGAFESRADRAIAGVRKGEDLTKALLRTDLIPFEFQNILEVAEETGNLPEVLKRQADHYDEEAGRRLARLASMAGYGIWLFVSGMIIWTIFRIFLSYLSLLQSFGG